MQQWNGLPRYELWDAFKYSNNDFIILLFTYYHARLVGLSVDYNKIYICCAWVITHLKLDYTISSEADLAVGQRGKLTLWPSVRGE